jgi:hypothetical protein
MRIAIGSGSRRVLTSSRQYLILFSSIAAECEHNICLRYSSLEEICSHKVCQARRLFPHFGQAHILLCRTSEQCLYAMLIGLPTGQYEENTV